MGLCCKVYGVMLHVLFLYLWLVLDHLQSLPPMLPCGTRMMRWLGVTLPFVSLPLSNKQSPAIPPRFSGMLSRISMVQSLCPTSTRTSKRRFPFTSILTSIPCPNLRKWLPPLLILVQSQSVLVLTRLPLPSPCSCRLL